ncbi:MAG: site-specific DNA-methyltransferase [Actinomycetota bacterium]
MKKRRSTATSNFGAGARESHDASAFYERFRAPDVTDDDTVLPPKPVDDPFVCGDARDMSAIADGSVALVVTSPPYFAGKQYEEELERDGVPSTYIEYLELLRDVFAECVRTLEPGGRIAVNVANLGRKPYRSLSADVIGILERDLGLLLRGELIWQKGEGASGSCAWGSYRSAANPVLRDVTERVIVASKGRFDRARTVAQRKADGLPHENTMMTDDFLASTLDVWSMPSESARRVGHPAPFPIELPEQLIQLYTFVDDLVLDPFMGSGSTLVAAETLGRRYIGYDTDPEYVSIARERVAAAVATADTTDPDRSALDAARTVGSSAGKLAAEVLQTAGFEIVAVKRKARRTSVTIDLVAVDAQGGEWWFDVAGPFVAHRGGLALTDEVWRLLGRAHAIRGRSPEQRYVALTTELPRRSSEGDVAMRAAGPGALFDAIDITSDVDQARLTSYARSGAADPQPGFWRPADLAPDTRA